MSILYKNFGQYLYTIILFHIFAVQIFQQFTIRTSVRCENIRSQAIVLNGGFFYCQLNPYEVNFQGSWGQGLAD